MSVLYIYKFLPDKIIYIIVCKTKEHGLENLIDSVSAIHQYPINIKLVLGTYTLLLQWKLLCLMPMGTSQ